MIHAALRLLPCLEQLVLVPTTMQGSSFDWLVDAISSSSSTLLRSLKISCDFDHFGVKSNHVKEVSALCKWLHRVRLETDFAPTHIALEGCFRVPSHTTLLQTLTVFSSHLEHVTISSKPPADMSSSPEQDVTAEEEESQALQFFLQRSSRRLQRLELSGFRLSPMHCQVLALELSKLHRLEHISLVSCRFPDKHGLAKTMAACFRSSSVRAIHIASPICTNDSLAVSPTCVLPLEKHLRPSLKDPSDLFQGKIDLQQQQQVSAPKSASTSLRHLSLQGMCLNGEIAQLVVQSATSLRVLQLESCDLSDAQNLLLCRAACRANVLERLEILSCRTLSTTACFQALRILRHCTSLRHLVLRQRHQDNTWLCTTPLQSSLLTLMRQHFYLTHVQVNGVGPNNNEQIATLLRLNRVGRCYLLLQPNATHDRRFCHVVAAVSDSVNDVYTHLLENPAIFCRLSHKA